jgi:hypothetical protein
LINSLFYKKKKGDKMEYLNSDIIPNEIPEDEEKHLDETCDDDQVIYDERDEEK